MATEPRKPKFTNRKVLNVSACIAGFIVVVSMLAAGFWWPPMLVLAFTAGFALMYLTYIVDRLNRHEAAQWVTVESDIERVTHTLEEYQLILRDLPESSPARNLCPMLTLKKGGVVTTTAKVLGTGATPPTGVRYEARWIDGHLQRAKMKFI